MFIVWSVLALLSFVSAFFAPLYFMIVGIAFGTINLLVILTLVVAYFQSIYYGNKLNKELEDGLQLQESKETSEEN